MTTIVITQPNYIPWFGWFALAAQCEVIVLLDTVQMTRQDWRTRNRILGRGGPQWISIPVAANDRLNTSIASTLISPQHRDWGKHHWGKLCESYGSHKFFDDLTILLQNYYVTSISMASLVDFTIPTTIELLKNLVPNVKVVTASSLFCEQPNLIDIKTAPNSRILAICNKLNATRYVSSLGARHYLDTPALERNGIEVSWFDQMSSNSEGLPRNNAIPLSIVHDVALFGVESICERIQVLARF